MVPMGSLLGEKAAGRKQKTHEYLYWELGAGNRMIQGVRMGNWKAVRMNQRKPIELFDLGKDVGETEDLAAARPEIMAKIEGILATCRTEPRPQIEAETDNGWKFR